jgi:hypothetical protein
VLRSMVVAAALAATASAALAAPGPDFSKASCDTPAFHSYILGRLGHGKYLVSGKQSLDRFNYGPITQATMVSNTGKTIACEISVDWANQRGVTRSLHGRFTAMATPNGAGTWKWQPNY